MKINIFLLSIISFLIFSCSTVEECKESTDWEKENLKGNVKSISIFQDDVLSSKIEYNQKGFKTKSTFYLHNGELYNEQNFEYINDFLGAMTSKFANGENYKTIYERDNKHRIIKETSVYANGKIDSRIEFEYNDSDQVIKKTYTSKKNNSYCYTFEYSLTEKKEIHCTNGLHYINELSDGLVIKRNEYTSNGKLYMAYSYEYNEQKDVILECELWNDRETDRIKYIYEYDNTGNWLSKIKEWKNGEKSTFKRKIIYY